MLLGGLVIGAGVAVVTVLSLMTPRYSSEAQILIDNDETAFTRPVNRSSNNEEARTRLDPEAVTSQVQVLKSRDLALKVVHKLDLQKNPEFNKHAGGPGVFKRFLIEIGLAKDRSKMAVQERILDKFAGRLSVSAVERSRVISVNFSSKDPRTAADVANALASEYLTWQQGEKLRQNRDASKWLSAQIEELRQKVAVSEANVEKFRSKSGLFAGRNNLTLNAQQLSELNSQLILAKAQRTEAEARARLIKKMLRDKGDVGAASDVLRSELIQRLLEQRVQVQRQLAELSATLMSSHPRIKQLRSELTGVRRQIRQEASKIVKGLENEAQIAGARERSLRSSLNELKQSATQASEKQIKLRALEREAKSNRDLLESYLARYRDASARRDELSVPAHASIIARAHVSNIPSFPKKGPITALVMAAVGLLALAFILARELLTAQSHAARPGYAAPAARAPHVSPAHNPAPQSAEPIRYSDPVATLAATGSLDMVRRRLLAKANGASGQSVLLVGETDMVESAEDAVDLARTLAGASQRVVLVDISEASSNVAAVLGLPRMPGVRELAAGRATFEQVVRLDPESPVQVFSGGDPRLPAVYTGDGQGLVRIVGALREAYDVVLVHANRSIAPHILRLFEGAPPTAVIVSDPAVPSNGNGRRWEDLAASIEFPLETVRYERGGMHPGPFGRIPGFRSAAAQ
ncbi:MAG: GumC family protein [Methyloligellaceae bacterium]